MSPLLSLVPNVFYDLICRIAPGFALILLYCPTLIIGTKTLLENLGAILAAWALGITLDVLSASLWRLQFFKTSSALPQFFQKYWPDYLKFTDDGKRLPNSQIVFLKGSVFEIDADTRLSVLRAMADRAFFRVMFVVSLIALSTVAFDIPKEVSAYYVLVFAASVAFASCWWIRGIQMNREIGVANDKLDELKKSPPTQPPMPPLAN